MAFFKFRKGAEEQSAPAPAPESVETLRKRARHRLVGAVILVLAGVVAHGAWTSRKNRPRQATQAAPSSEDSAGESAGDKDPLERQEPEFDGSLEALTTLTSIEKKASLDGLIDVIAPISIDAQVSGEAALAAMPATRRVVGSSRSGGTSTGLSRASGALRRSTARMRASNSLAEKGLVR